MAKGKIIYLGDITMTMIKKGVIEGESEENPVKTASDILSEAGDVDKAEDKSDDSN